MKKTSEIEDWPRPEYEFSELNVVARGPGRKQSGEKTIALAPDVVELFPTSESVNEALRLLGRIARESSSEASLK